MERRNVCARCRYFDPEPRPKHEKPRGQCRKNAPQPGLFGGLRPKWPDVEPTDWCGEFSLEVTQ